MAINIAIELGTTYTSIFVENYNVVLREPSVVAFMDDEYKTVRAVGKSAIELQGKTTEKINFVFPVREGYVEDLRATAVMLKEFLHKIFPRKGKLFGPILKATLSIPAGLSVEERRVYEEVCIQAGISQVRMIDKVVLSAIGANVPVSDGGSLLVSIGGGSTEIAIVSVYSIIAGCSVNIGGNMMDNAIKDYMVGKYGIKISRATAKKLKEEIGSLYANDVSKLVIKGLDTESLTPVEQTVYATDVYEVLYPYYERITEGVMGIINECPTSLAESLHDRGVFVTGGGSKIPGLKTLLKEKIDLPITMCKDPEYSAVCGGGKIMTNKELLQLVYDSN